MVAASPNPQHSGGLEVEGDPQLQSKFETSLRYIRHCLMWGGAVNFPTCIELRYCCVFQKT